MSSPIDSETDLQKRRLTILKGISQDLKDLEIAAQLGVNRWMIQRDLKLMQHNSDPRLKQAESSREATRSEKRACLMGEKVHAKQSNSFLLMTGMTLEEKTFRKMIDFHKTELMKITNAEDQDAAIRALPRSTRRTMRNNGVVNDWRITAGAKTFSKRVRFSERANKDIGLKGSMATSKGVCWEYHIRYSEYTKQRKE